MIEIVMVICRISMRSVFQVIGTSVTEIPFEAGNDVTGDFTVIGKQEIVVSEAQGGIVENKSCLRLGINGNRNGKSIGTSQVGESFQQNAKDTCRGKGMRGMGCIAAVAVAEFPGESGQVTGADGGIVVETEVIIPETERSFVRDKRHFGLGINPG